MENDNNGDVDDSRPGQQQEAEGNPQGIESKGDEGPKYPDNLVQHGGLLKAEEEELEAIPEEIEDVVHAVLARYWSGLLPPPEEFNQYPSEAQAIILQWNDEQIKANVTEESSRQSRLVDSEIKQAQRGQILSGIIIITFVAAAVIVTVVGNNAILATLFIGIPFATIIGNLFRPVRSKSSAKKHESTGK